MRNHGLFPCSVIPGTFCRILPELVANFQLWCDTAPQRGKSSPELRNVWEQLSKKQWNLSAQNVSICSLHFKIVLWKLLELQFSIKHSLLTPVSMKIKDWTAGICHRGGISSFAQLYPDEFCFVAREPELKRESIDLGTATPWGEQHKLFYSLISLFSFSPLFFKSWGLW